MPRPAHFGDDLVRPGDRQSILFSTGTMVNSCSIARKALATRLRLHALEGIDQEDGALARGEAARDS